jgi:hypothetical protein
MRVGNNGARDRTPRIDVEIALRTIETFGTDDDEVHR